jgi:hypothetical protein
MNAPTAMRETNNEVNTVSLSWLVLFIPIPFYV